MYTDEFEIVNPIGSRRKKHKLIAFYWTLLNISAEYHSKLSTIQLLALAKACDVKKYGVQKLLYNFSAGLQSLKSGITVTVIGVKKCYKGFLVCVLADTPAAQLIGGFKEGVGKAISPCRTCDAKRSELPSIITPVQCPLRNEQEHTTAESMGAVVGGEAW